MCRHLAYLGPPVPLATFLFDPPHSLARQSWAPRDMRGGGTINADGYGVGWFPTGGGAPVRLRRDRPIWSDADLPGLAAVTSTSALLAAVRSATAGMPVNEAACAPFVERAGPGGGWLFSLNGRIIGWPDTAARLAAGLPPGDLLAMDAPTDSALLWALIRHRLRAGADPAVAVSSTVSDVVTAAPGSRLNLLLTDGDQIVATTLTHALSCRAAPGSVLVSSEPLDDDPAWLAVPEGSLLVAGRSNVDIVPLPEKGALP